MASGTSEKLKRSKLFSAKVIRSVSIVVVIVGFLVYFFAISGNVSSSAENQSEVLQLKLQVEALQAKLSSAGSSPGQENTSTGGGASGQEVASVMQENTQLKRKLEELTAGKSAGSEAVTGGGNPKKEKFLEAEIWKLRQQVADLEHDRLPSLANCSEVGSGQSGQVDPTVALAAQEIAAENLKLKERVKELEGSVAAAEGEKQKLQLMLHESGALNTPPATSNNAVEAAKVTEAAQKAIAECGAAAAAQQPSGSAESKGYVCRATEEDLKRYQNYTVRGRCPDDWYFVQQLIFGKDCFALPRRRCIAVAPNKFSEPMAVPQAHFDQGALMDGNVDWSLHKCKSFECLNTRELGDCRDCFDLTLENHRWRREHHGTITMAQLFELKKGGLRIGLDAGGGTGTFAAKMAEFNVTILTTAMNTETVGGFSGGLPYMETIAARGLVPLHVPHKARQPFYDNTLDIIHAINSVKYLSLLEFEELLFEWNRILRPGGIWWFELFYTPEEEMPLYVAVLEMFNYTKLYWNFAPKTDKPERGGAHLYLNCVLEKPFEQNHAELVPRAVVEAVESKAVGGDQPEGEASSLGAKAVAGEVGGGITNESKSEDLWTGMAGATAVTDKGIESSTLAPSSTQSMVKVETPSSVPVLAEQFLDAKSPGVDEAPSEVKDVSEEKVLLAPTAALDPMKSERLAGSDIVDQAFPGSATLAESRIADKVPTEMGGGAASMQKALENELPVGKIESLAEDR